MFYVTSISCRRNSSGGFDIPYMLTGQLNMHPRVVIEAVESDRTDFVGFYDEITAEE